MGGDMGLARLKEFLAQFFVVSSSAGFLAWYIWAKVAVAS